MTATYVYPWTATYLPALICSIQGKGRKGDFEPKPSGASSVGSTVSSKSTSTLNATATVRSPESRVSKLSWRHSVPDPLTYQQTNTTAPSSAVADAPSSSSKKPSPRSVTSGSGVADGDREVCRLYLKGFCKYGRRCRYVHDAKTVRVGVIRSIRLEDTDCLLRMTPPSPSPRPPHRLLLRLQTRPKWVSRRLLERRFRNLQRKSVWPANALPRIALASTGRDRGRRAWRSDPPPSYIRRQKSSDRSNLRRPTVPFRSPMPLVNLLKTTL
jgi:hypothetical protein